MLLSLRYNVGMTDFFHNESLGGDQEAWRERMILAAQQRAQDLEDAIAEFPDKVIKFLKPNKR